MNSEELIEYLVSVINNYSEIKAQDEILYAYLTELTSNCTNYVELGNRFELILSKVYKQVLYEKPYISLYVPKMLIKIIDGDIDYIIHDFIERLMRLGRILQLLEPSKKPKVIKLCRFIAENIDKEINMDILANQMFMNKKYLSIFIKANLGINFVQYIRKVKVERTKKLLCDTDLKIYEISEALHFNDAEYFSKVFKIETGMAPSDYSWYPNDDISSIFLRDSNDDKDILIGIIGAYSGEYSYLDGGKRFIYEYAAEEINARGGICGRRIKMLYKDYQSDLTLVESKVHELISANVDVIIGGYLSSAREIIRPIVDKNKVLYLYDSLYEGGIADHYTFTFSSMPEQNLLPVIEYLFKRNKTKFYILATDYNYGILSCEYAKHFITKMGGEIVAIEYVPNQKSNFSITIENILELNPEVILTFLVGERQSDFFEQWHQKENTDTAIISTSAISQGHMHITTKKGTMENVYFSAPYTEELDLTASKVWRTIIREKYNNVQIPYLGSDHEAAYLSICFYKEAVEKCNSTDTEKVIHALESRHIVINAPGGIASINPRDHHLIRNVGIYRVNQNNQVELLDMIPEVKSVFVETVLNQKLGVKDGLKELGRKSPNIQYNLMLYKI